MNRTLCVICNEVLQKQLTIFENIPIKMSATSNSQENDVICNQEFMICERCGCIQLKTLIDPNILYDAGEYHHPGTVGKSWSVHHNEFAKFIAKYNPKNILEIGAGNTILFNALKGNSEINHYYIVDPSIKEESIENLTITKKIFDVNYEEDISHIDTVVHSHTMEHFYNVMLDTKHLVNKMNPGSKLIISVPLIDKLIEAGHTNNLNWEHTYLTTKQNIEYVLKSSGLQIIETIEHTPFNLFVCAEKMDKVDNPELLNEFNYTFNLWQDYIFKIRLDVYNLNTLLKSNPYPTFLFGAHVSTQVLIANGLNTKNFIAVLDNSIQKHNKRLYGTDLFVLSPSILNSVDNARVVVRVGQYSKEVREQLQIITHNII